MEAAYSLVFYSPPPPPPPASQTPYTRQAGKKRLMKSDRHADGHRDTWGCGQVAGEMREQVGVDRGRPGEGGGREGGQAAEVSDSGLTPGLSKQPL